MNERVKLNVFYPYGIDKVWQALSDRRILSTWMMDNDFEPRLGHKFKFERESLPGIKTVINCEVVELNEPTRLAYTWQDGTNQSSLVVWTLTTVENGTQLQLKHLPTGYVTMLTSNKYQERKIDCRSNLSLSGKQSIANFYPQILPTSSSPQTTRNELNSLLNPTNLKEEWHNRLHYRLTQTLQAH